MMMTILSEPMRFTNSPYRGGEGMAGDCRSVSEKLNGI